MNGRRENLNVDASRDIENDITRLRKKLGSYAQNIASRPGLGYVFDG